MLKNSEAEIQKEIKSIYAVGSLRNEYYRDGITPKTKFRLIITLGSGPRVT